MNREKAKSFLPLIQALAEGKTIQMLDENNNWIDSLFINVEYDSPEVYRIKPEPKYRPFNNARECWEEMQKHQPFGWVKCKDGSTINKFMYICDISDYDNFLEDYVFADGTPFGILEDSMGSNSEI